ncbi:unnamed protein product [Camellia sinensis]
MKEKAGALELDDQASRGSSSSTPRNGMNRGVSTLDFILRLIAIMATLVSAIAMGTTSKTLPFITWFIHVFCDRKFHGMCILGCLLSDIHPAHHEECCTR